MNIANFLPYLIIHAIKLTKKTKIHCIRW